jgi:excisionase family DNA binding protein
MLKLEPSQMSTMPRALPFDCPRGLNRVEAARYVGVSPGTFDQLVRDSRMPKPKRVGARLLFDRHALDLAFDALGQEPIAQNDFDRTP